MLAVVVLAVFEDRDEEKAHQDELEHLNERQTHTFNNSKKIG